MTSRTAFVVVEGPDGAGKTTQSKALAEYLGAEWRCFPDRRTPIGALIDRHLKGEWSAEQSTRWNTVPSKDPQLDALVFQGLQLANRLEVQPDIMATLETGQIVICDRYSSSGYVYGAVDGLDPQYMLHIQRGILQPTIAILLDVPLDVAIERLKARGAPPERHESGRDRMKAIADRYRELWSRAPAGGAKAWVTIDASGTADQVQRQLRLVIPDLIRTLALRHV